MEHAIVEVLSLPVRFLADLPRATTIIARADDGAELVLTASRIVAAAAVHSVQLRLVLTPREYEAIAEALADGCLSPADARAMLAAKRAALAAGREYRITRAACLGSVVHPDVASAPAFDAHARRHGLTLGDLVSALGVQVVGVEIEGAEGEPGAAIEAAA